jgi:hypothetical protein
VGEETVTVPVRDLIAGVSLTGMLSLAVAGGVYKEKVDDLEEVQGKQQEILLEQRAISVEQKQITEDVDELTGKIEALLLELRNR